MICDTCGGRKIVQGFGGVRKECEACDGTGRIADKSVVAASAPNVDKRSKTYRESKKHKA